MSNVRMPVYDDQSFYYLSLPVGLRIISGQFSLLI